MKSIPWLVKNYFSRNQCIFRRFKYFPSIRTPYNKILFPYFILFCGNPSSTALPPLHIFSDWILIISFLVVAYLHFSRFRLPYFLHYVDMSVIFSFYIYNFILQDSLWTSSILHSSYSSLWLRRFDSLSIFIEAI